MPEVRLETFDMAVGMQCNARCTFCFSGDYTSTLSESILSEWREFVLPTAKRLHFGGGEPLLVAGRLMQEAVAVRPDIRLEFTTNGILLDRLLLTIRNVSGFNVSLNAGTRQTYWRVMGVDAFDRVLQNVRNVRQAGYTGLISSSFVVCRENIHDVGNYVQVCKANGMDTAGFIVDQTDPFLRIPHGFVHTLRRLERDFGFPVKIGRMGLPGTLASRLKQLVLYYLRYRPRRMALLTHSRAAKENRVHSETGSRRRRMAPE
jgi:MoaA/NifB/PqqE/SkfB family radical SAM enzyme